MVTTKKRVAKVKKAPKVQKPKETQINGEAPELFQIEEGVPLPPNKISKSKQEYQDKFLKTFKKLKVPKHGEHPPSFVIPGSRVHASRQILNHDYPEAKYKIRYTDDTKKFARVWRIG
jgi:hypothetical protein